VIDHGRHSVLGVGIDAVDYEAAVARIMAAAREGRRYTTSALAVHGVMTGAMDPQHRYRLNALDLVVPDGQPVRWALRWLHGIRLADRVYGPNLTLRVLERAEQEGMPVYFYGSTPATLERLLQRLRERLPALVVAGSEASKFRKLTEAEVPETADRIRASGARIVLVGLGCPRQEVFAYEMGDLLGMPALAVGAAFDFHAGTLKQAPPRLQGLGLEWAFRLWQEPGRLWRRYLYLNPLYLGYVLLQRIGALGMVSESPVAPSTSERYG
jgi:N-acetylglucosaminyldiphosphoundecaprenol N-acetyl-beta-D-mannosaminyltransferase